MYIVILHYILYSQFVFIKKDFSANKARLDDIASEDVDILFGLILSTIDAIFAFSAIIERKQCSIINSIIIQK